MNRFQRVFAKIDLDCLSDNADNIYRLVNPATKIMAVVKTDAYGHGCVPIAKVLQKKDYMYGFGVATYEEAMELRNNGIKLPILILGYSFPDCFESLANEEIRPALFREDSLPELSKAAKKTGRKIKVHVKVDTGMSRIGIRPDESGLDFVRKALNTEGIELEGIFTHFSRADEEDKSFAYEQFEKFKNFIGQIKENLNFEFKIKHCSNSAGIIEIPEANMDVVRPGIILYGLEPSACVTREKANLKPVMSIYSHIIFVKELEAGRQISYGGTYVTENNTRVATVPVGYGDGYPRSLSNRGYVLIHGKKAPILGKVCMDQLMVDISDIPDAKEDDLVTLVGRDGNEEITPEMLGSMSDRFNYEFVCDLGKRIPRVYVENGSEIV